MTKTRLTSSLLLLPLPLFPRPARDPQPPRRQKPLGLGLGLLFLGAVGLPGCDSGAGSSPTQYMNMTYSLTPPGVTTGSTVLKLPVITDALQCQRSAGKIQVSATSGAAGITITLVGAGTNPQAALRADKDTATVAEVSLKLPQKFDARTLETADPLTYLTSDRTSGLSCTLTITGSDPFASFDGSLSCSTLTGSTRDAQANAQFHAVPCP
ncbi:MAG TPA: hypothetical protein PKI03_24610 [Pseudomonadota bacterium]|nr:hypothetical protein [Pseudomonadota bacterium]